MNPMHILVVEDEADIRELLQFNLEKAGYRVSSTDNGLQAVKLHAQLRPDLILLDLMIPGLGGRDVCRQIRLAGDRAVPIIMVTARGSEADIVAGLEAGADDYVTKPFSPKVLLARVQAAQRRKAAVAPGQDDMIDVSGLQVHPGRREVVWEGQKIALTNSEFQILHFLARRPGWVFTRYQIVDGVKGEDYSVTDRAVDVAIVGLRKKLGTASDLIETVRGVGYRFKD